MQPSEIRQLILDDHVRLRALLAEVSTLARRIEDGETGLRDELRERGRTLRERFLKHLALEDAHLVPALRAIDAWGPERADRVTREHTAQRADMEMLLERLGDDAVPAGTLAVELDRLVRDLEEDMEHEEAAVLQENLLRDDVVGIDVEAG